jgi:hypothetical protein
VTGGTGGTAILVCEMDAVEMKMPAINKLVLKCFIIFFYYASNNL